MSAAVAITIPVHDEPGWSNSSPDEMGTVRFHQTDVKARLESGTKSSAAKSPEALHLQEKCAAMMHQLHLDAVAARAARETQRAKQAKQRRLREEANQRQLAKDKLDAAERKAARAAADKQAEQAEKTERREALRTLFWQKRTARQASLEQQQANELERCVDASAKRAKALQALVDKSAYEAKRALAVAAAAKEKEGARQAAAVASLSARLGAAEARRGGLGEATPPATRKEREHTRHVAASLHAAGVAREEKRLALQAALAHASGRRDEALAAVKARAEAANARAAEAAAKVAAEGEAAAAGRREHFAKLNDAEVRRATLVLQRRVGKAAPPPVIEVSLPGMYRAPPAALVERLSKVPTNSAALQTARHAAAEARAAKALEVKRARAALCGELTALLSLETKGAQRRVALATKTLRAIDALAAAQQARVASAHIMNGRVAKAKYRREWRLATYRQNRRAAELIRTANAGRRAERLLGLTARRADRHLDAADRRALAAASRAVRGAEMRTREGLAAAAAERHIARRAAHAKIGSIPLCVPAKLAADGTAVLRWPHTAKERAAAAAAKRIFQKGGGGRVTLAHCNPSDDDFGCGQDKKVVRFAPPPAELSPTSDWQQFVTDRRARAARTGEEKAVADVVDGAIGDAVAEVRIRLAAADAVSVAISAAVSAAVADEELAGIDSTRSEKWLLV